MAKRSAPEINAGSMADIAFLLLIFFLVTTTVDKDKGLIRSLPPIQDTNVTPPVLKEKNVFVVIVNKNDELLVEDDPMEIGELRQAAKDFLDNGGTQKGDATDTNVYCGYCQGARDVESSDNPGKAIISVKADRETSYETYINVQNELVAAYNELRNRESQRLFGWNYTEKKAELDTGVFKGDEEKLKDQLSQVKELFPMKLSEAEAKKN